MDVKTLEALRASIAKWERNAEAECFEDYRTRDEDCPLCDMFKVWPSPCELCPVFERSGEKFCRGTPYSHAANARYDWRDGVEGAADRAHAAARDEVAFLKSLLPEETP